MRLAVGTTVLATVAGCGGAKKDDPYLASLAKGSEHVEFVAHVRGRTYRGTGDFVNDRGHYTFTAGGKRLTQVYANNRIYIHAFGRWVSGAVGAKSPQTPAQMFRRRLKPATFENGLVKSITIEDVGGTVTYTFSKYGEHVSVTVPTTEGSS